jgi:hypothetical protein
LSSKIKNQDILHQRSLVLDLGAQVIPIDGKTLKGFYDRNQEQSALHVVSAWASKHRLFLGQLKINFIGF